MQELIKEKKIKKKTKKELEEELKVINKENSEYKELLQRITADFQNYKKRVEKDKEEWKRFATKEMMFSLLEVLDNFELALKHKGKDETNPIWDGVKLIHSKLMDILTKFGLEKIDTQGGEKFDPTLHEALFYEEGDEEEGRILSVCRAGYKLWGELLRPVGVTVSKGKPLNNS